MRYFDLLSESEKQKIYSSAELEAMDIDDLDRLAFGVAGGYIIKLWPDQIHHKYDDVENAQYKYDTQGGMKWVRSVKFDEPVDVSVNEDGRFELEDGHHRWFAAKKLGRQLNCLIDIKGNPIRAILKRQATMPSTI